jgi:hypothetical protein
MASIPRALRELVTARAKGLCEYCQTAQAIVIEIEIDHIIPISAGGETVEYNLCLACAGCNSFKHDALTAVDPETKQTVSLYNPRTQNWDEHFIWSDTASRLIGITPCGRATIEKLKINREHAVRARERWVKAGWHPPVR